MAIVGIAFPFQRGKTSFPMARREDDVISDNIKRIMLTRRGERVMRPGTGASIWDIVFDSTGSVMMARLDYEVRRSIAEGEPRARVLAVDAYEKWQENGMAVVVNVVWDHNEQIQQTAVDYTRGSSV